MLRNKHQEDWNPGSDPSSDPSSDPGSNPGSDPGSDPGFIISLSLSCWPLVNKCLVFSADYCLIHFLWKFWKHDRSLSVCFF